MPSSNKTPFLGLNRWIGTDKPKREDFNTDNSKIDDNLQGLQAAKEALEATIGSLHGSVSGLDGRVAVVEGQAGPSGALQAKAAQIEAKLSAHSNNSGLHVTSAEKNRWNSGGGPILYTYTGNGRSSQKITLGYEPKFCYLFAVSYPPIKVTVDISLCEVNCAFLSIEGCTDGVMMLEDGFVVYHDAASGNGGYALRLNRNNATYLCAIWK